MGDIRLRVLAALLMMAVSLSRLALAQKPDDTRDEADWQAVVSKAKSLSTKENWRQAVALYEAYEDGHPTGRHANEARKTVAELTSRFDRLWDPREDVIPPPLMTHTQDVPSVTFSQDGKTLLTGG